jgi:Putative beta-barrel porin-2, OmpL-like. bbp2
MAVGNRVWWSGALIGLLLGLMPAVSLAEQPAIGETNSVTSVALEREGVSQERPWFFGRLWNAYAEEFNPPPAGLSTEPEPARRALPAPWDSPPYPSAEYQGSPLIGVPVSTKEYPLMKALGGTSLGEWMRDHRLKTYGWVNGSYNWSTSNNSNMPSSYWIVPKSFILEQAVLRLEREADTVQTDHVDVGFRLTGLYGSNYRYMTAGGYFSNQLLKYNQLYGFDPTEMYADTYIPNIADGLIIRLGRWVATPDIEVQFAPDNYLATHSLQFTYDTYTQTGAMATLAINKQWTIQGAVHSGTDMAPWYQGAVPTGMVGVRWVSLDNNDSAYVVLNNINTAKFRHFDVDGQPAGHDNFNYVVGTWQHRFNQAVHTKTAGIYMWQRDAVVGGTPSLGPTQSFGGGGGRGAVLPGMSLTYGILNYTMFQIAPRDFITVRNEWWRDERGMRSGFAGHYSTHTVGLTHQFNDIVMIRPEAGYYRNYTRPAFDLGTEKDMFMIGADMTVRF